MKKVTKSICVSMSALLIMTSVPVAGFAAEQNAKVSFQEVEEAFIKKVDKYVKIDSKTKKFSLSAKAKENLNREELGKAEALIKQANFAVDQHGKDLKIKGNTLVLSEDVKKQSLAAIGTSEYWDYELFWWGYRIYFSDELCEDIRRRAMEVGASGTITAGVLTYLGVPGWAAGIIVGFGVLTLEKINRTNEGNGIYLDAFHGTNPSNFHTIKIYPA
ncbi:hypothetical protein [Brevibacillus brevis]|uniref:hypothetical protein n=1 Tax=Brevibacillus brevis TaxID=1393 RepID=UPI0037C99467